eukprot:CAMPEP_0115057658 /NCGR_PEP_ID=MMETSP0227-20121206/5889_1 /TAXON_ID=89957 /ORGANISM="Polarella glacialis, Strain CCMP 1383" /LENGTH=435 /DNA_ID=CAMNT_0002442503 /DNA_START=150 /DNA_END=1457 /DNA_ORIENTATION=-
MKPACFNHSKGDPRPHMVYIIGDWGGVLYEEQWVLPADRRQKQFKDHHRPFIKGADDCAQQKVAEQMKNHAERDRVDYVLNVGDNFYWGGLQTPCGQDFGAPVAQGQWQHVYEWMYDGEGLKDKQWLGVLGNHDYGGWNYLSGWDQNIAYTWGGPGSTWRWFQPALYYKTQAIYDDFKIDYFFVDTNVFDAFDPYAVPGHNICSMAKNPENKGCGKTGPFNVWQCKWWFIKIWNDQMHWIEEELTKSNRDGVEWQIIVTHFPPMWGTDHWQHLTLRFGIDVIIAGHVHLQSLWEQGGTNMLGDTAVIISGGGGGITSEKEPNVDGWDDQYGFMKLEPRKDEIIARHFSHGGILRKEINVHQRHPVISTTLTTTFTTTSVTSTSVTSSTTSTTLTTTSMTFTTQSYWSSDSMLKIESALADLIKTNGSGADSMDYV